MSTELSKTRQLPSVAELHQDLTVAFQNDQLNLLLNQQPPVGWLKDHPTATQKIDNKYVPIQYLPVEKVELMLTRIFQQWKLEVISYAQLFQSVTVHVRLHYLNPTDLTWYFQDGLGAVGVQTDKGESAANLAAIKQDAVMKALPAAESYALKDAAEKLGILFGKNLNRKDTIAFTTTYTKEEVDIDELKELYSMKGESLSPEEQIQAERIIKNEEKSSYHKLKTLLKSR